MSPYSPDRRREGRLRLLNGVRCRIAPGQSPEVELTEISVTGCQIVIREGLLKTGQNVVIKTGGLEGLPGTVRWIMGDKVGVEFEQPLHPAVLSNLLSGGGGPSGYTPAPPPVRSPELSRPIRPGQGRRSCL